MHRELNVLSFLGHSVYVANSQPNSNFKLGPIPAYWAFYWQGSEY